MNSLIFISNNSHLVEEKIRGILEANRLKSNHPDVLYFKKENKLGIAEARVIKEHFSLKPYSAKGRVVVLEDASSLTLEAQNALLKTLEEPPPEALLVLAVKKESDLLPTIISRCQIEYLKESPSYAKVIDSEAEPHAQTRRALGDKEEFFKDIDELQGASYEERFKYIEKLEERQEFLKALIYYFREKMHQDFKYLEFTKKLLEAEMWAKQNVNIRGILEYLMLEMPK